MKAYAIKNPNNFIILNSIKDFEDDCMNEFVESRNVLVDWETIYKAGYRCVPVEITEIKNEKA